MIINSADIFAMAKFTIYPSQSDYVEIINPAIVEPVRVDTPGNGRRLSRNARRARRANRDERIRDNRLFKMLRGEHDI